MKDWTGNTRSTFATLGASSHADHAREVNDYYATDPKAAELLLDVEPELSDIWEPACGAGHLAKVFAQYNRLAAASILSTEATASRILISCNAAAVIMAT